MLMFARVVANVFIVNSNLFTSNKEYVSAFCRRFLYCLIKCCTFCVALVLFCAEHYRQLHGRSLFQITFQKKCKFMYRYSKYLLQLIFDRSMCCFVLFFALHTFACLLEEDLNQWPSVQPPCKQCIFIIEILAVVRTLVVPDN